MFCPACNTEMHFFFKAPILNKYDISYYKCMNCGFIQTETPFWLPEAYNEAISSLDVGLVQRNITFSNIVAGIIKQYFNPAAQFIDYAGGYGLFVRLMRDKGFDFYRQDTYCENLFATHHDVKDLSLSVNFELLTAFEVFEHLANPVADITDMFNFSDTVLFSTQLQVPFIKHVQDWWYFLPESGQHIAFYTRQSLQYIAATFNSYYYSDGTSLHMFSRTKLPSDPFLINNTNSLLKNCFLKLRRLTQPATHSTGLKSLTHKDFELAKHKLKGNH